MATLKAANKTLADTVGSDKIGQGEQGGKLKMVYDSYTLPGVVLAVDDIIEIFKLPAGAVVHEVIAQGASLGTTGIFDVGYAASASGDIVADPNGFIPAVDLGGAAAIKKMTDAYNAAGLFKSFDEEVLVQAVCTEISTATDTEIEFTIAYTID